MLKFYQEQLSLQSKLASFLAIYPFSQPTLDGLRSLTQLQVSRLNFLIQHYSAFSFPSAASMEVGDEYHKRYSEQQALLAPIVTPERVVGHLPNILLPGTQMEEDPVLEQRMIDSPGVASRPLQTNVGLSGYEPAFFPAQFPPSAPLFPPVSLVSTSEKSAQEGEADKNKFVLYAEKLNRLRTKGSQQALSLEEKREARLLSNKLSAQGSRNRKKEHLEELEASVVDLGSKNQEIQAKYTQAVAENRTLRETIGNLAAMIISLGGNPETLLNLPQPQTMAPSNVEEEQRGVLEIMPWPL